MNQEQIENLLQSQLDASRIMRDMLVNLNERVLALEQTRDRLLELVIQKRLKL